MILLDTNVLGRMTDAADPQCGAARRAVHSLLASHDRPVVFPQGLYEFWAVATRKAGSPPGSYQNVLICGISTQLRDLLPDWDDIVDSSDADFSQSGLHRTSAVRPSCLYGSDSREIAGVIGRIDAARLDRVRRRLARRLS